MLFKVGWLLGDTKGQKSVSPGPAFTAKGTAGVAFLGEKELVNIICNTKLDKWVVGVLVGRQKELGRVNPALSMNTSLCLALNLKLSQKYLPRLTWKVGEDEGS